MKKRIIQSLLAIVCCVTVALSAIPTAEAAMRASVVTGKVTLNGQVIDNKTAKYPLLIYSNITYFPMTYHLSRFMGVSADWNNGSKTLDITAGGARTAYAAETGKKQSGSVSVTLPSYKISVNGAQINNKEEKYPIFNYNGITYFPLTWAYAVDSFGWSYQWDAVNGLRIDTSSAPPLLQLNQELATPRSTRHSRSSTAATPRAANTTACLKAAARRRASTPRSTSAAHRMSPP